MTIGSRFGTNVHPVTVCLTARATILHVTAGLTPDTNITLETVGVQDTGRLTAGTQATGRRATGIGRMGAIMAVMTRGAHTMWMMAGIRVIGIRVVGVKRTSVTTSTTTFTELEVDPGEPLADTAAQSGIIDLRPFRKAEEALFSCVD